MSLFGRCWKIGGLVAGPVTRWKEGLDGGYSVIFERADGATVEKLESIDWAKPVIEALPGSEGQLGLPEGYGFEVENILYSYTGQYFTVILNVAKQYLGDVTAYQDTIEKLTAEKVEQDKRIGSLEQELAEADETAIALYEALESNSSKEAAV